MGGLVTACTLLSGCSSDSSNGSPTGTGGTGGAGAAGGAGGTTSGAGGSGGSTGTCTSALQLIFSPAYSAYDGKNTYKVPAIAVGVTETVTWKASDPSMVDLDPDTVQFGDAGIVPGRGVMITTRKP